MPIPPSQYSCASTDMALLSHIFWHAQSSLVLKKQPLICPRPLNLSVLEEMVIRCAKSASVTVLSVSTA